MLNSFFSSVFVEEPPLTNIEIPQPLPNQETICNIHITPNCVETKLCKLKPDKASGPDKFHVNLLRQCPSLSVPLCIIFNMSIQTSYIPQDWRDANVVPIHKKGPRSKCNNYRPVSLTSQIVKLLERIILEKLLTLLHKNNTISCNQHGFQSGAGCH